MDVVLEKHNNQYTTVNKMYITGKYTIDEACKKVGICKKTYYNIKKRIKEDNQKGGKPKLEKNQTGGANEKKNIINPVLFLQEEANKLGKY